MRPRRLANLVISRSPSISSNSNNVILPFEAIPGPRALPLIGSAWKYFPLIGDYNIDTLHENALFNRNKYGPLVREQIAPKHVVLHLFDPDDVEAYFRQDSSSPYRRSHRALLKLRQERPKRYNDGGLFPENGKSWSRLRGLFQQYFMKKQTVALRSKIIDDMTRETLNSLVMHRQMTQSSAQVVRVDDVEKFLSRWSVRCGLAMFLDYTHTNMPNDRVLDRIIESSGNVLEALAGTEIKSQRWVNRPDACPHYKKLLEAENFMYEFVRQRIDQIVHTSTGDGDQLSFVREWLNQEHFDRRDVITFMLDFVLADIHTTVFTATYMLQDVSRRLGLDMKKQLFREISLKVPPTSQPIMCDIGDEMPVLKDCFKETLRLHPVSIGTGRLTQSDMIIRGYHIPRDVMVIAHNQVISRDRGIYEEPDEYRPDRWARYKSLPRQERPSPFAFLPFGFGARSCLGQRLVSLQLNILAARLFQTYELKFLDDIKTKTNLVHCLDGEIGVEFRSRDIKI